jgi:hypothetical protein
MNPLASLAFVCFWLFFEQRTAPKGPASGALLEKRQKQRWPFGLARETNQIITFPKILNLQQY